MVDTSGLVARRLTRQRWAVCASPDYLARCGTPQTLEELTQHRCIVGHRRGQPLAWRVMQAGQTVRYAPPSTHQIGDGEAMILVVRQSWLIRDYWSSCLFAPLKLRTRK